MPDGRSRTPDGGPPRRPVWLTLAPLVFLLLWSGGYSAVKISQPYVEPLFLLVLRYAIVLAVLVPAWAVMRPRLPATAAQWTHLAVVGLLIQGLYFGGTNLAVYLGASAAGLALVLAMQPLLMALAAPAIAGEVVGPRVWVGLLLGLAGSAVAILAKSSIGEATVPGILVAAASLVFITVGTLYDKRFGSPQHPIVANAVQCGVGLLLALPLAVRFESLEVHWTRDLAAGLAYLALANSIVAMTLLLAMVRRGAAGRATALMFLVPPTSAAIAMLILGEPMPQATWLGMALAAAGVLLVRRPGSS